LAAFSAVVELLEPDLAASSGLLKLRKLIVGLRGRRLEPCLLDFGAELAHELVPRPCDRLQSSTVVSGRGVEFGLASKYGAEIFGLKVGFQFFDPREGSASPARQRGEVCEPLKHSQTQLARGMGSGVIENVQGCVDGSRGGVLVGGLECGRHPSAGAV